MVQILLRKKERQIPGGRKIECEKKVRKRVEARKEKERGGELEHKSLHLGGLSDPRARGICSY